MDSTNLDWDKMTRETLEYRPHPFRSFPSSPGLIYHLEKGVNTFCLRGSATPDIKKTATTQLRDFSFFETGSYELAEILKDQMLNRRIPLREDLLLNMTDPSFYWWMKSWPNGFQIYFKHPPFSDGEGPMRLGPLGDAKMAYVRLNQSRPLMAHSFPVEDFSCDEKQFLISTKNPAHLNFHLLKNIFLRGENPTKITHYPKDSLGHTLFHYFQEIAMARKFWMAIEEQI